ncbi:MAG: serine/threonine-protein kinase [Chloroflexota bacterium]|nr:MAG: serine/threonine-protein kinase [Chloroflexota bacterium]
MNAFSEGALLQDRYELRRSLGRGGMGQVYLASDRRLANRPVAIKALSMTQLAAADRGWRLNAFRQEASLLASLDHPGLTDVSDFFVEGDTAFLVMDYVPGRTLSDYLAGRPNRRLQVEEAIGIAEQICEVLAYLHGRRPPIIFRDLKPDNIMVLPDGQVKLIDFGIARYFRSGQTQDTQQLGTLGYAAPEQYSGQTDARSDIYSLGVVLHQMVTGFDAGQLPAGRRPPPLGQFLDATSDLDAVISIATQLEPDERFQSAAAMRQALTASGAARQVDSRRFLLPAAGFILLLAAIGISYVVARNNTENTPDGTETPALATMLGEVGSPTSEPSIVTATTAATATVGPTASPSSTPGPTPSPTTTEEPTIPPLAGEGVVQVTSGDGQEYVAVYSPDQERLVFSANPIDRWQIYGQPSGGGAPRNLTVNEADNYHPHFSPDGRLIVYASNESGDWEIYSMATDGSSRQQLTSRPGLDQYPSFSADGQWIVYMSERNGTLGVYAMSADGSDDQPVVDSQADETFPTFSPDGRFVTFQSDQAGGQDIYLVAWPDGVPVRLTTHPARDATPVFSPDGQWIAFESDRDGDYEVYAIRPDGSNLRNLTDHPARDQVPSFTPDGKWIVFSSDRGGEVDVYRQAISGE